MGVSSGKIGGKREEDKITWDSVAGTCQPQVCGPVDVRTIYDFEGHVSSLQLAQLGLSNKLRGTKEARDCLSGRKLLLLGDSTLGETAHDLAILLSGIGRDRERTEWYISNATRLSSFVFSNYTLPTGVSPTATDMSGPDNAILYSYLQFNGTKGHRNMTLFVPSAGIEVCYTFLAPKIAAVVCLIPTSILR